MNYQPSLILERGPQHEMNINNVLFQTFHVNTGEGINSHTHDYSHVTICHAGKIRITKSHVQVEMDKNTPAVMLKGEEWHQIEAIEDNTVFVNVFAIADPVHKHN